MTVLSESERARRTAEWTDEKTCFACKVSKPRHSFQASAGRRDGVSPYCRDCVNARMRAKYAAEPEYRARQVARRPTGATKTAAEQEWRRANPTCPKCGTEPRCIASSGVVGSYCRSCFNEWRKARRRAAPSSMTAYDRRERLRKWSMTIGDYDAMLERQGGGCAICGGPNDSGRRLAIDHDHSCCPGKGSCGKCVRGLLCSACNVGIGSFHEDAGRLSAAIAYLTR